MNNEMRIVVVALASFSLSLTALATAAPAAQSLSEKREVLQPEVIISTRPAAEIAKLPVEQAMVHVSEVSRTDALIIVVSIKNCQADAKGLCNASADVTTYTAAGTIHDVAKGISLNTRRGTAVLNLTTADAPGLYKVVATVRDLNAKRFGTAERQFGVK